MLQLAAIFILVTSVEALLLLEVLARLGLGLTFLIVVATGVLGAALARSQGLAVLARIQRELGTGVIPGRALLEGAMVLVAGALLMTPGLLTDGIGFACLIPQLRGPLAAALERRLRRSLERGEIRVWRSGIPRDPTSDPIDVDYRPDPRDPSRSPRDP